MCFIYNDQIKMCCSNGRQNILPLGKINRSNNLVLTQPYILAKKGINILPPHRNKNFLKPLFKFSPPLVFEMSRGNNENSFDQVPNFQFLDQQTCHNGFARSGIISN
ncbi:hypothetical protein BMS3Bbin03_01164 [bacterium BMS3Bbin03]|nr:hypothetical protein BMS3Bbin03_01164 [bacterium BMS3Bbin03]